MAGSRFRGRHSTQKPPADATCSDYRARAAPPALIELADTVSEANLVKHAFQAGVQAMPGIEW